MRTLAALLLSLFVASTAFAQTPQIQRVEVVEYGIYTTDKSDCARDDRGILICGRSNTRHAVTTKTIPAQLGVEFGLRYRVIGAPSGARVVIKRDWLLPAPGFQPPGNTPLRRLDRQDAAAIGEDVLVTYGFDDSWELVTGSWVMELWDGDRRLAAETFTITRSQTGS